MDTAFEIRQFNTLDLFDANKGIAVDGVGYNIRIISSNINTFISVDNPNTIEWREWENQLLKVGKQFAVDANDPGMLSLFS